MCNYYFIRINWMPYGHTHWVGGSTENDFRSVENGMVIAAICIATKKHTIGFFGGDLFIYTVIQGDWLASSLGLVLPSKTLTKRVYLVRAQTTTDPPSPTFVVHRERGLVQEIDNWFLLIFHLFGSRKMHKCRSLSTFDPQKNRHRKCLFLMFMFSNKLVTSNILCNSVIVPVRARGAHGYWELTVKKLKCYPEKQQHEVCVVGTPVDIAALPHGGWRKQIDQGQEGVRYHKKRAARRGKKDVTYFQPPSTLMTHDYNRSVAWSLLHFSKQR